MGKVATVLLRGGTLDDLVVEAQDWDVPESVAIALGDMDRLGIGRATTWLLLALWVASRRVLAWRAREQAAAILAHATDIGPADRQVAREVFERTLKPPLPGPLFEDPVPRLQRRMQKD
jgi:hypothetical protein